MAELHEAEQRGESAPEQAEDGEYAYWSADSDGHETFAVAVCEAIRRIGYCIIRVSEPEAARRGALQAAMTRDFLPPRPEFEEAYLGLHAQSKVAWLDGGPLLGDQADDPLAFFLGRAAELVAILGPFLGDFCGFTPWGFHSGALLRAPLSGAGDEALYMDPLDPQDVADGVVEQHLDFIQRRRLCLLYPIESWGSTVKLNPREDLALQPRTLSLQRDELLVFRHDIISYAYLPKSGRDLLLQTWVLDQPQQLQIGELAGDQRSLQAIIGGPPMPVDKEVHIMCGHCKFPGRGYRIDGAWKAWHSQLDCFREIPVTRWDMSLYYSDEPGVTGKAVAKHCAMLDFDEMASFDNNFFGLTDVEASLIVPGQRLLLELMMEAFKLGLGLSMPQLQGRRIACVIADIGTEWDHWCGKETHTKEWLKVGGIGYSIGSAARVGYTFGITGPMHQVDTACSASLIGANVLHGLVRKRSKGVKEGIMMAYMNYFMPFAFVGLSSAGMLGRLGRSVTFDQAANGYARGEGVGGLVVKRTDDVKDTVDRVGCYVSSFINQDGRSASLTAPNGPSQQACIRSSMRESQLRPEDVAITENHGTGTALGDPIEVGSIRAVFRQRGQRPLPVTSGKTHMGHLESGAGSVGLLKTLVSLAHASEPPNVHLRHLNAHIEIEGFPGLFPTEGMDIGYKWAVGGLNSFGFGGTNSRAELWARCVYGHRQQDHWSRSPGKLDAVTVPCARCLGAMCWLCGVAISGSLRYGKHHCSAIREELASYDYCSNCFGGSYKYGDVLEDLPDYGRQLYLVGTWSVWSTFEALQMEGDSYVGEVMLGETLRERFRLVMEKDHSRAIYPVISRANQQLRIVGPDGLGQGKDWLIDGRRDGVPAGTVYRVTFEWGTFCKSIRWEPIRNKVAPQALPDGPRHEHSYYICGSLTAWTPVEMRRNLSEPGTWEFSSRIRTPQGATFAFLRDNDITQTIYPLESMPTEASVPVMGPGDGAPTADSFQHWSVRGRLGTAVAVRLRVEDGAISVSAWAGQEEVVWKSPPDNRDRYYVVGSFNGWSFSEMVADEAAPDVYRLDLGIGARGVESFQIVVNRNWDMRLYPAHANASPGLTVVYGPSLGGDGLNWSVTGPVGQMMEIVLDLTSEDRCSMVSCQPCMSVLENA